MFKNYIEQLLYGIDFVVGSIVVMGFASMMLADNQWLGVSNMLVSVACMFGYFKICGFFDEDEEF